MKQQESYWEKVGMLVFYIIIAYLCIVGAVLLIGLGLSI